MQSLVSLLYTPAERPLINDPEIQRLFSSSRRRSREPREKEKRKSDYVRVYIYIYILRLV